MPEPHSHDAISHVKAMLYTTEVPFVQPLYRSFPIISYSIKQDTQMLCTAMNKSISPLALYPATVGVELGCVEVLEVSQSPVALYLPVSPARISRAPLATPPRKAVRGAI